MWIDHRLTGVSVISMVALSLLTNGVAADSTVPAGPADIPGDYRYTVPPDPTLDMPSANSMVIGVDPARQIIEDGAGEHLHPAHRQRSARVARPGLPALKQQMLQDGQVQP